MKYSKLVGSSRVPSPANRGGRTNLCDIIFGQPQRGRASVESGGTHFAIRIRLCCMLMGRHEGLTRTSEAFGHSDRDEYLYAHSVTSTAGSE